MNKDVFRKLRQMLMEELDLSRELSDKEILDVIDELILNQIKDVRLALKEKVQLRQELFYSVRKLDVLQELVDDETVTEIMVNGPDTIFVERAGKLMKWHKSFTSAEKLEDVIQQIVGKCNRVINESMPIVDARLENGSRVNAVIYPVALNGPILTIRRFPEHPITMEKLIALGSITQECAEFLEKLVKARYSMVIGGGTGSGKTTFLAAMSEYIPRDERLITIEDNAELRIRGIDNLVRLEAKMANMEGADDYIMKPFDPKEMVARVRAVLRRYQVGQQNDTSVEKTKCAEFDGLTINLTNYSVVCDGHPVDMPPKELELLYCLAASPNQVFTREQLLDRIWGYEYIGDTRTVDVHIKRLREKIKDHPHWNISTVWGIGYKFETK